MRVLVVWIVAVTEMKPIGGKMRQCVTTLMFVDDRNIDRAQNRAHRQVGIDRAAHMDGLAHHVAGQWRTGRCRSSPRRTASAQGTG